ncbi:MAG: hypothetical protein HC810_00165 [Acaryochloridaceae cyanobacterium RL_2_7]|nr:hypothetical protein [Acaryochloridaceae cyanobacterium RL_2_7]
MVHSLKREREIGALQTTIVKRLDLHQAQRCQSVPTLSVLVGKSILARQLWSCWSDDTNRPTVVCVEKSSFALFEAWLKVVVQHHDLRSQILQQVAILANQSVASLSDWLAKASGYEHQLFGNEQFPYPRMWRCGDRSSIPCH